MPVQHPGRDHDALSGRDLHAADLVGRDGSSTSDRWGDEVTEETIVETLAALTAGVTEDGVT